MIKKKYLRIVWIIVCVIMLISMVLFTVAPSLQATY